jgi:hypothetical protein
LHPWSRLAVDLSARKFHYYLPVSRGEDLVQMGLSIISRSMFYRHRRTVHEQIWYCNLDIELLIPIRILWDTILEGSQLLTMRLELTPDGQTSPRSIPTADDRLLITMT